MPESQPVTGSISVDSDTSLYSRTWPVHSAKANLLIIHGYAEHCERYDDAAERLNARGYNVYSYDQRGHGQSPGTLGQIPSFDALIDDASAVLDTIRSEAGNELPWFIWGHSMGGLVTSTFVIRHQPDLAGIILTGPGVKSDETISPMLKKLSGFIAAVLPSIPVHALDSNGISRDEAEVKKYVDDPKVYHGKILARTGNQLVNTINFVEARYAEITLPAYILHGTEDRLVNVAAGQALYDGMGSEDKTLKLFEGGYHELHNDIIRDEFYRDILDWLDKHI